MNIQSDVGTEKCAILSRASWLALCLALGFAVYAGAEEGDRGTVRVPGFELPLSAFLSPEARSVLGRKAKERDPAPCPSLLDPANLTLERIKVIRSCSEEKRRPHVERMQAQFDVAIESKTIAGVPTEIFTPRTGIPAQNKHRVLINLHGGGFVVGSPAQESIPIAGLGKIKVIGVNYRMGPEHKFPAASEDVAAVYRETLKEYRPASIGIYGCSAGGRLTSQAMAWFQKVALPNPAAVGIFGSGAGADVSGDSAYFGAAISGADMRHVAFRQAYFGSNPDLKDPLLAPLSSPEVLAKFPPALLISGTRDYGMSNVIHTHSELVRLGVQADLHLWDGLGHCFFFDPDLPESRQVWDVIVRFFNQKLH